MKSLRTVSPAEFTYFITVWAGILLKEAFQVTSNFYLFLTLHLQRVLKNVELTFQEL